MSTPEEQATPPGPTAAQIRRANLIRLGFIAIIVVGILGMLCNVALAIVAILQAYGYI